MAGEEPDGKEGVGGLAPDTAAPSASHPAWYLTRMVVLRSLLFQLHVPMSKASTLRTFRKLFYIPGATASSEPLNSFYLIDFVSHSSLGWQLGNSEPNKWSTFNYSL